MAQFTQRDPDADMLSELSKRELLVIRFKGCTIKYMDDFTVRVEGEVYPRHLRAANDLVQRYKECSKEDKENLPKAHL
jgi:hypothetical protein